MIGVSGGENSVGLVHMLMVGKNDDHKKLLFTPELVWIDEGQFGFILILHNFDVLCLKHSYVTFKL